ncbi:MAG: hypothetical protein ACI970_000525 [Myxococcota bacterium]|jgi:hypothetical protein
MEGTDDAVRPSRRAAARLADDVGRDLGAFRVSLTDAMAQADRLQHEGRTDLAVDLLEQQRLELARVYEQVIRHIAAAAVEREAESILAAVEPVALDVSASAAPVASVALDSEGDEQTESSVGALDRRSLTGRVLASAMAAVLGVVLLMPGEPDQSQLTIASQPRPEHDDRADDPADADAPTDDDDGDGAVLFGDTDVASDAAVQAGASVGERTIERVPADGPRNAASTSPAARGGSERADAADARNEDGDGSDAMILDGSLPPMPLDAPGEPEAPTEAPTDDPSPDPSPDPSDGPARPGEEEGDEAGTEPMAPPLPGVG